MIKVLIVEDSPVVQQLLHHILSSDPEIRVIGTTTNGEEALKAMDRMKPDVITMDINMPKMSGLEATRKIMETNPVPIVIVSGSWDIKEVVTTFRAMEAGALAVVQKPVGICHPDYEATARELVQNVKLMSEVKVVRRWTRSQRKDGIPAVRPPAGVKPDRTPAAFKLVVIGASTGGPIVLQNILSRLPKDFPAPVLIVQHIAPGFVQGFVEWLAQSSGFPVHLPEDCEHLQPGHVYVAPDGCHTKVEMGGRIALVDDEPENGHRPSISYLLRSVAYVFGQSAIGVLLTGMGKDGAEELKLMKEKDTVTIVQDEKSSVVYGMPGEAIKLNAATYVLPPEKIAAVLESLVKKTDPDNLKE